MAGAPPQNVNAMRHGLACGSLPRGCGYVLRITQKLRDFIEEAVRRRHGELSLWHGSVIQTALRWERHAMLAQRWLRKEHDQLTADQRLNFSREVARASSERDKCLRLLGLDRSQTATIIEALYSQGQPEDQPDVV